VQKRGNGRRRAEMDMEVAGERGVGKKGKKTKGASSGIHKKKKKKIVKDFGSGGTAVKCRGQRFRRKGGVNGREKA